MGAFVGPLEVQYAGWGAGRPRWRLLADVGYVSDRVQRLLIVPSGFETDLASVPRLPLAWWLAGMRGSRAAVLHDYAYQTGGWRTPEGRYSTTRAEADAVFWEAMRSDPLDGTGAVTAALMYLAVRLVGRGVWAAAQERHGEEGRVEAA